MQKACMYMHTTNHIDGTNLNMIHNKDPLWTHTVSSEQLTTEGTKGTPRPSTNVASTPHTRQTTRTV